MNLETALAEAARKARRDGEHWTRQCHRHAEREAMKEQREAGK